MFLLSLVKENSLDMVVKKDSLKLFLWMTPNWEKNRAGDKDHVGGMIFTENYSERMSKNPKNNNPHGQKMWILHFLQEVL